MNLLSRIQRLPHSLRNLFPLSIKAKDPFSYSPTIYMKNPILQLLFGALQPKMKVNYDRWKIYQTDGGHVALDWYLDEGHHLLQPESDILLVMHGLTGGVR